MLDEAKLQKAVQLLVEAAAPRKIILFGSYARNQAHEWSDFDFIVVKDCLENRRRETARLRGIMAKHGIPADIILTSAEYFEHWKSTPGTVLYEASLEGRTVYEVA